MRVPKVHFQPYFTPHYWGIALLRSCVPTLVSVIFLIYVVYLVWMSLAPQKPMPDSSRKKLADIAVNKIVATLTEDRQHIRTTLLLHFENDPADYFTNQIRKQLNATGILILEDKSFVERLRDKLKLPHPDYGSYVDALAAAKDSNVQGVLWGTLSHFETLSSGSVVKGKWQLIEILSGNVICEAEINEDTTSPAKQTIAQTIQEARETLQRSTSFFARIAMMAPWYIRVLLSVLSIVLLPIVTFVFIRFMVAKRSNTINVFLLGGYTCFDAVIAFFMIGGEFDSGLSVIIFLVTLGLIVVYNYFLMNFALKLES